MLRIALPNKGALSEDAVSLIKEAGYKARRENKELSVVDSTNDVEFLFLRPRDIAVYVSGGIVDAGITGRDLLADSRSQAKELLPLGFGKSRFCYAVPNGSPITEIKQLDGLRIATSYPNIVKDHTASLGMKCSVVKLDGAVEISVRLGVADAIADVVESGTTMRQAGLHPIDEPVMYSEALVIGHPGAAENPQIKALLKRIQGILTARAYVVVDYNVPKEALEAACAVTPGVESPTVTPLSKEGWFAVKSMVKRSELNSVIDRLEEAGASGIIVSAICTCRL
jgi:ATP phosphoribosyltransferase